MGVESRPRLDTPTSGALLPVRSVTQMGLTVEPNHKHKSKSLGIGNVIG